MAHHGKNKKKKKVKKKRISKYAPGGMGSTYGQVEYGPNILEVPGADRNMQIYLDQNQRIFSNNLNNAGDISLCHLLAASIKCAE